MLFYFCGKDNILQNALNLLCRCDIMVLPNQLYNAENENITIGVLYPFCTNNEFVKNANSVSVGARSFLFRRVGLATNGVCVFGALTSVSALFIFRGWNLGKRQRKP